jgi:hypothetical protein
MFNKLLALMTCAMVVFWVTSNYPRIDRVVTTQIQTSQSKFPTSQIDPKNPNNNERFKLNNVVSIYGCTAFDLIGTVGSLRYARHCIGSGYLYNPDGPVFVDSYDQSFNLAKPNIGSAELVAIDEDEIVRIPIEIVRYKNDCVAEFVTTKPNRYIQQRDSGAPIVQDGYVRGVLSYGYNNIPNSDTGVKRSTFGGAVYTNCTK